MALEYVTLICDEGAGQGYFRPGGTATLTPSAVLTDATDHLIVDQSPITVTFSTVGPPSVQLLACDNANLLPAGWGWTFTPPAGSGMTAFTFFLDFANGATQYLSAQTPVSTAVAMQGYMPEPSGAAEAGWLPFATGVGQASKWGPIALPFVTVSPIGSADDTPIANNGADYGPDTPGTVTRGVEEAVNYAVTQALAGATYDVQLLGGKFDFSQFTNTTYRSVVTVDAGRSASTGPPVTITIRGTGRAMTAPEGTSYIDAYSLGATVIDASALDVLAQGLYKQGRIFLVTPYAQTGPGLVNCPIAAVQLLMENLVIIAPTYHPDGTGSPVYNLAGTNMQLFVAGDTASANAAHWQFVNGIDAWAASSFEVNKVSVISALAAFNADGNQYAGGGGVAALGSACGIVFPENSNQGCTRFENISVYDVTTGITIASQTSGDQYYSQCTKRSIYMHEGGQGATLGKINPQATNVLVQHALLPQLTTSLAGGAFDPKGDLYAPAGMTFPTSAQPGSLIIGNAVMENLFTDFLVDDPSNPLTLLANVDIDGTFPTGVWGGGANMMINFIDTASRALRALAGTTAGTATYSQSGATPWDKRTVVYLSGYENTTATPQTITFLVPYNNAPAVIQDATGTAAASATVLTLPASMSAPVTGYIILEGY